MEKKISRLGLVIYTSAIAFGLLCFYWGVTDEGEGYYYTAVDGEMVLERIEKTHDFIYPLRGYSTLTFVFLGLGLLITKRKRFSKFGNVLRSGLHLLRSAVTWVFVEG